MQEVNWAFNYSVYHSVLFVTW